MAGTLFVVSTPIGNLKDITHRAVEVLKAVQVIACEDTRHSRHLLSFYGVHKPLVSLYQGREKTRTQSVIERLEKGEDVAFICDAGTPNISDPGYRLVSRCVEKEIPMVSVPGSCALISALSISGLPTDAFVFEGFLPPKKSARCKKMQSWKGERRTIVYYESPHRFLSSLEDLSSCLGNISIVIARELTKKFEEVVRGPVERMIELFRERKPLGEFVILFNLRTQPSKDKE